MSLSSPDAELTALLDRVGQRDTAALQQLYERTSSRLFGLAMRVVRQREVAEDVLQEAFLTIWRSAPDYRASLSPPMAWMGVVVRSRGLDFMRRRARQRADQGQELDDMVNETVASDAPNPMVACTEAPAATTTMPIARWAELTRRVGRVRPWPARPGRGGPAQPRPRGRPR